MDKFGDEFTFNRRWRSALMAYFLRRVRNHAEAEDLTQEVFVRVLNSAETAVPSDGYIFQIAANLLADRARRAKVRDHYRINALTDKSRDVDILDPHKITADREKLAQLTRALTQLPDRTRTIFILYRFENMSQDAIGESFGISASAVKQQVAKAMAFLLAQMKDDL